MKRRPLTLTPLREARANGCVDAGARFSSGRWMIAACLLFVVAACEPAASTGPAATATAWPEADALFHQDPRWLGADAAYSVQVSADETLWLFGDTFIATSDAHVRSQSKMVHNTVALQHGLDPSTATISFAWRDGAGGPGSFFADDGDGQHFYWPLAGTRARDNIVVFLSRVRATPGEGLGFQADGWRLAVLTAPTGDDPRAWNLQYLVAGSPPPGLVLAPGLVRDHDAPDKLVALAITEPGDHAGFLASLPEADLGGAAPTLDGLTWWDGKRYEPGGTPARVMADAGPECSLHYDERLHEYVHVRSDGFGATTIVLSVADRPEGLWSTPRVVYRPPESARPDAFVYAAKGHPELLGADLVVTYATNTFADFATLVSDTSLYYPRFVRLTYDK
jgi:hypothetical protein